MAGLAGPPRDILMGLLAPDRIGLLRPRSGVAIGPDAAPLLVADDVGDVVWRVSGAAPAPGLDSPAAMKSEARAGLAWR